ncbi:MAG: diacylglyceryl transferase [Pirellulaceae bacterium]|nr:diacylglyceryl transferase [Pirellulaceae bacterium]
MRRTLLLIPHEIAGIPIFGIGWLLGLIVIALVVRLVIAKRSGQSLGQSVGGEILMWGIVAAAVVFVLPAVELKTAHGEPVGMAIRGYGVMLLAGVSSAVGLAAYRAKNRNIDPDVIYSLAPWVFVGGIAGARIFYLVQYRDKFQWDSIGWYMRNLFSFTEGGLVVYGSFIGGFLAGVFFITRHKLPLLRLGDAIIPCMFLGVFLGRIGCLMNGCCYGGRCEDGWAALRFPAGSAVYGEQLADGELLGLDVHPLTGRIENVHSGSLAAQAGIEPGSSFDGVQLDPIPLADAPHDLPVEEILPGITATVDGRTYRWSPSELPKSALPVQAAQLISSISALTLCLLLCGLSYVFRKEGAIMMLGFAGYATLRFILEMVRVDEAGQFGTLLTISQWVSVVVFLLSAAGMIWVYRRPSTGSALPGPDPA